MWTTKRNLESSSAQPENRSIESGQEPTLCPDLLGEGNSTRMVGLTQPGPEIAIEPAKVDGGETSGRMRTCWGGEVSKRVCLAPFWQKLINLTACN